MGKLEKLEYHSAVRDIDRRKELEEGEGEVAKGVCVGLSNGHKNARKEKGDGGNVNTNKEEIVGTG